jgi:hypothetical protein
MTDCMNEYIVGLRRIAKSLGSWMVGLFLYFFASLCVGVEWDGVGCDRMGS